MAAKPATDATEPVADPLSGPSASLDYDAFLSYTHRDRPAVSGIQKGLHRIGRRLGQLRALRVFRDDTDLTASPDLWGRIVDALDRSRFFIVTLRTSDGAQRNSPYRQAALQRGHRLHLRHSQEPAQRPRPTITALRTPVSVTESLCTN